MEAAQRAEGQSQIGCSQKTGSCVLCRFRCRATNLVQLQILDVSLLALLIPFSAFWLRSSVVSVLISLISDMWAIGPHDIKLIFLGGGPA
ncbi:hypothetical protein MIMGU_mgv1a023081mg, partial [Erythranthe guttata]